MAQNGGPKLSLNERDQRYGVVRENLRERGVDCAIVSGSNLFYLTNGVPGERFGLLPADETPITVFIHGRHLADISPQVVIDGQDWVKDDVRSADDAAPIIAKIKELGLDKGTIGVINGGRGGFGATAGLTYAFYTQLQAGLPDARLVEVGDIFANVRTVKTDAEIAMIDQANRVFDAAVRRIQEVAKPGMLGKEVVQEAIKAMWDAGGDMESTLAFQVGAVPGQNPVKGAFSLEHRIQEGDLGTTTAHAHYGGYGGHSDHMFSFGPPKPLHQQMYEAVCFVRDEVLKTVKPGVTHRDLVDTYTRAVQQTDFRTSPHSQIHQYGIDVPEFPGPSFSVRDEAGGGRGNFTLKSGMIYSISPTLVSKDGEDTMLGGTSLVVTDTGYRELGDRKVELLVCG